jgi:hypothetical protein
MEGILRHGDGTNIVLTSNPDIEVIFCGSDQIARGVADARREAGRCYSLMLQSLASTTGKRWRWRADRR